MRSLLLTICICLLALPIFAQHLLGKVVSVNAQNEPLASVLNQLSKTGNFQFSYKSDIVLQDKKVSIREENKTVKYLLDKLLEGSYHYTEKGKYIIIHAGGERFFTISGFIQNGNTGERLSNVTVYEDQILASTLTNEQGYFKLPIKNKRQLKKISIVVRKESFSENVVALNAGYDQELILPIVPSKEVYLKDVVIKKENEEPNWANKFFISSKQKIQNINIGNFMANRPIQTSLLPGIGTRGMIGSQVSNKFSFNMIGGYTGGVEGFEIGTVFNINKGDVKGLQISGVFNSINGNMQGCQIGAVYNYVSKNVDGVQISGIGNIVKKKTSGVQIAGISNLDLDSMRGVQISGISNHNQEQTKGVQLAGIANINKKETKGLLLAGFNNHCDNNIKGMQLSGFSNHARKGMKGVQMAGIYNYARKMKGLQFGLINIADTMDGAGIGLVNIYGNGLNKLVVSSSDIQQVNVAYLSGAKKIHSIIGMGANADVHNQLYSAFFGIGRSINLSKRWSLHPECYGQVYYLGDWGYVPVVGRAQLDLSYKVHQKAELFAGASYSVTENRRGIAVKDYSSWLSATNIQYQIIDNNKLASWIGWQMGLRIF
jgi:hypothetical protein